MSIFLIIVSCVLWLSAIALLWGRQIAAPIASFLGLLCISFARSNGYPLLPVNGTILTGWLCMSLVVMFIVMLQPGIVRAQTRGMGYMVGGALTGLAVGLLAFTFRPGISLYYGIMIVSVIIGIFIGFLMYTRTPGGRPVAPGTGNFFRYLLAKGFPTAITVMQLGVVLVLTIALNTI